MSISTKELVPYEAAAMSTTSFEPSRDVGAPLATTVEATPFPLTPVAAVIAPSVMETPAPPSVLLDITQGRHYPYLGASPLGQSEESETIVNPEVRHDGLQRLPGPHLPEMGPRR